MQFLLTIAAFIVALSLLVVIHELGHYLVARVCNVKVLRFSLGFGKRLASIRRGSDQTEWSLAAIPLGGYVKMLDEREGEVAEADLPRAFNRQTVGRRFAIVIAGPTANLLLAVFFYWLLFVSGVPGLKPVIAAPAAQTPAAIAGFNAGDMPVSIAGERVDTWQDVRWQLMRSGVGQAQVSIEVVDANQRIVERDLDVSGISPDDLDADFLAKLGFTRLQPELPPVIGEVVAGGAAAAGGLQKGDRIVAISGKPVAQWSEVVAAVRANPERALQVQIDRGGTGMTLTLTPQSVSENGAGIGRIGAAPQLDQDVMKSLMTEVRYGPFESLGKAVAKTWDTSVFTLQMLGKMVMGQVSLKNISGPITIADYAGQSAQVGWIAYVGFLALISISLAVLNLLPIPLLDGGHLMYYIVEIITGSPVSEKVMEIGQQLGMALLFTLMALAIYNDINRLIGG
ncbi:MAG: RIP metalloprotease RseP [Burkholderiales bacterium]|nr:RIP metalloprotease RseP [Burkholderiales bacterium]